MSTADLEAALAAPGDSDAQHCRSKLVSQYLASRDHAPKETATSYLQAFCDLRVPAMSRRWFGLLLRKLLYDSSDIADHFNTSKLQKPNKTAKSPNPSATPISQLGHIIVYGDELEETKIVAGLIIRQLLHDGIEFSKCWPSEKVANSAPDFPMFDGLGWMAAFQNYLDILLDLRLMESPFDSAEDAAILYPLCVLTDDGFRWRDPEPSVPVAIVEDNRLTLITTDISMTHLNFLDIPLSHILCIDKRKSDLHDSQKRANTHEPWDLVLLLKPIPSTYFLNGAPRTGKEVVIAFQHRKDAAECETSINERLAQSKPKEKKRHDIATIAEGKDKPNGVDGLGSESERERLSNLNGTHSHHHQQTKAGTVMASHGNSTTIRKDLEPNTIPNKSVTDAANPGTNDQMTNILPNHSQKVNIRNNVLPRINKSKAVASAGHVPVPEDDEFAFPEEAAAMDTSPIAQDGTPERSKRQSTARARPKAKSTKPQAKPISKPASKKRAGNKRVRNVSDETEVHEEEAATPRDYAQLSTDGKRRREGNGDEHTDAVSTDDERRQPKRRRAAKKVSYNEPDLTDDPNDSDFVLVQPKRHRSVEKQAVPSHTRVPKERTRGTNRKVKVLKKENVSASQRIVPTKHGVVSSLLSKTRREGESRDLDSPSLPLAQSRQLHLSEHTTTDPHTLNGNSEKQALQRLVTYLSESSEGARDASSDEERDRSSFGITRNASPEDISELEEVTAVEPAKPSSSAHRTISPKKRLAPSTPENARHAKRLKNAQSPELPTTIAPPRKLEEPKSPSLNTKYHRSLYGSSKVSRATTSPETNDNGTTLEASPVHPKGTLDGGYGDGKGIVRTPASDDLRRTSSASSEVIFLLSSNSKPLPAPPTADSTAISSHSSGRDLQNEEIKDPCKSRENPFLQHSTTPGAKRFAHQLTAKIPKLRMPKAQMSVPRKETSIKPLKLIPEESEIIDLEGDTFVTDEEPLGMHVPDVQVDSSPPKAFSSPSSHSSTSAEAGADSEQDPVTQPSSPNQEAEDREWEESLKPYQRTIGAQLTRISQRLLRHIVDNETAVNDIAQTYAADANTLFDNAMARQNEHFETSVRCVKAHSLVMKRKLEAAAAQIRRDREGII